MPQAPPTVRLLFDEAILYRGQRADQRALDTARSRPPEPTPMTRQGRQVLGAITPDGQLVGAYPGQQAITLEWRRAEAS